MSQSISNYYDLERSAKLVKDGDHRKAIGGLWDEMGKLQIDYVKNRGLVPSDYFLDIGCGCLRGGVHLVRYLEADHYFGTDLSKDLLDAGYDIELAAHKLQHKMPRENLASDAEFNVGQFGKIFDAAMAQSVFTHLPMSYLKLCLTKLADVFKVGGEFYVTIFHCPDTHSWDKPLPHTPGNIVTHPVKDPYHYTTADIEFCCTGLPWRVELIEEWEHPRAQKMVVFVKT